MDQNELQHFGVKGMKWGVRRQRGKDARDVYRLERADGRLTKKLAKADLRASTSKKLEKKNAGKLKMKVDKLRKTRNDIRALKKKKLGDLTPSELRMGKAQVIAMQAVKGLAVGALTAATGAGGAWITAPAAFSSGGAYIANLGFNALHGSAGAIGLAKGVTSYGSVGKKRAKKYKKTAR